MTKRTRVFLFVATGILVFGLGTGLLASYMGFQNLVLIGGDGPAELAYVPSDVRMLAFVNLRDVMDSELRQKLTEVHPDAFSDANRFYEETGVDIRNDVDVLIATLAGTAPSNERPLLIARGRFDTARIESLVREKGGQVEDYQGVRLLTHPEGNGAIAFAAPGLVTIGTPESVRRALEAKTSGVDVTDNADIMRFVMDVDDGNAWAVVRSDAITAAPRLPAELATQLPPISWFAASGHVNGGFRGVVHAEARDEAAANDLREVIKGFVALARLQTGQRAEFADLMNSIELGGQGKTVTLGFVVPADLIDSLARLPRPNPQPDGAPQLRPLPSL
jgi:hypothetical protein